MASPLVLKTTQPNLTGKQKQEEEEDAPAPLPVSLFSSYFILPCIVVHKYKKTVQKVKATSLLEQTFGEATKKNKPSHYHIPYPNAGAQESSHLYDGCIVPKENVLNMLRL